MEQEGLTAAHLRAARALLGWSQAELAARAGMSAMTVKRAEGSGKPPASAESVASIRKAFEAAGVEFTNGTAPGVRLRG